MYLIMKREVLVDGKNLIPWFAIMIILQCPNISTPTSYLLLERLMVNGYQSLSTVSQK